MDQKTGWSDKYKCVRSSVETQVSMGTYRPYSKSLYWTCWSAATFAIFAFSRILHISCVSHSRVFRILACFAFSRVSHSRVFRILACFAFSRVSHSRVFRILACFASRAFRVSDSLRFHASHELCTSRDPTQFVICALAYLAGFVFSRISCISHILHSRVFRTSTCATARLPGIHRILFACPVLILQGPLVHISLGFTRIISHMSLHSHLCSFISLSVYITSPLYV